jgi:hypothetical protein
VILAVSIISARLFSGRVRQSVVSPDGKYVAECRDFRDLSTVQLRTRLNPFRHTVVSLQDDAGLSVTWIDSKNLLVDCQKCGELFATVEKETSWHDVAIHYTVH